MRTELGEGTEFSNDFGENMEFMTIGLRIPTKNNVNNGFFDV
ncbi:TPA: cloacin, partial [Enterobacter hormaechei subsp. xiangfangensis]|nr:cloacin [Enterobacter hormaechei subsp. xiangfangensis]